MSITITVRNGVRIVHLRGPASDPLTERLAKFISHNLVREKPRKSAR
jgi:hypothetical protein